MVQESLRLTQARGPLATAQQPSCHPCSQAGQLHGWTWTRRRDLGTRRSCCSQGPQGAGGRSQLGPAAGRVARRTPAAPAAGPPCPLERRSPSPGGCLGQTWGRQARDKEGADSSLGTPPPRSPRRLPGLPHSGWRGPGFPMSLPGNSCLRTVYRLMPSAPSALALWITRPGFMSRCRNPAPCALPTPSFPSGLFADPWALHPPCPLPSPLHPLVPACLHFLPQPGESLGAATGNCLARFLISLFAPILVPTGQKPNPGGTEPTV